MAKKIIKGKIGNAITSVAEDHIVVVSEDVFDEKHQKYQSEINDIAIGGTKWEGEYEGGTKVLFDRLKSNLAQCINDGTIYFVTDSNGNFTQIALGDGSKSHVVGIGPKMDDATKQELMSKLGLTISSNMGTIQLGKLANHNGVSSQKVVTYERTGLGTDVHEISTVGYVQQYMKTAKAMVYAGVFNAQTKEVTDYNNAIISPSEEGNVTFDYLLNGNEGETLLTPGMSFIVGTAGNLEGYTGVSVFGGETNVAVGDMIIIINVQQKEGGEGGSTYNEASILIIHNTNLNISDGAITTAKLADAAVTSSKLSTDIQSLISNLSKTATFAGIATPSTNPGTPDGHVFYIANGKGTYTNFGGIDITEDEVIILYWDTAWHKVATGIALNEKVTELDEQINGKDCGSIKQPTTDDIYQQHLNSIGSWGRSTSNVVLIDVRGARGYGIRITNYSTGGRCGFVTDANLDGSAPVYCDGTSFFNFNGSDLSVPNDANYLIFSLNTTNVLPIVELIGGTHIDGIKDILNKKQNILISGENIKTINGYDILGEGNIEIQEDTIYKTRNLLNPNDIVGGILSESNGNVASHDTYNSSGFIEVTEGQIIVFSYSPSGTAVGMNVKVIAAYDENKVVIPSKGVYGNSLDYVVPSGVSYIRYSWNNSVYTTNLMAEVSPNYNPSKYIDFGDYEGEVVIPEHIFLPRYVYVAVGRTIEIYNDQICLEANKYHFQWICAKGTAFGRKFSVTGDSTSATTRSDATLQVGQHRLTLCIWDDNERCVWAGQTILVFNTATASGTILPIGDSLTNWKKWLPEVMHLSNNAISFIGTRYSGVDYDSENNEYQQGTIHHEGRSGWSAGDYRANATYDFDSRYDGVESVSGASNPFWNGSRFSLSHYLTTQGKSQPSAVQLFLGTNDLGISIEAAVQNIVGLVSDIREEYATIPIFVCNTIYRSKQDGYGSIGDDGYESGRGAIAFEYNEDVKVNVLMQKICAALQNMANVYIIPLASTHDTLYNFDSKEIAANPRAIQKVSVPIESVHPQAQGYFQMADEMYSAYCAVL